MRSGSVAHYIPFLSREILNRAVPMFYIKHDNAAAVFQQLYLINVLHSSRVCSTFGVEGRRGVHSQPTASIVVFIVAERIG